MTAPAASLSPQAALVLIEQERRRRARLRAEAPRTSRWEADRGVYINRTTGRAYQPHHDAEAQAVADDGPKHLLFKGGEGGGKSVAGIVKDLERLRRGMSGIMVSPDFEHFKRSLWREFRDWCPWQHVVEAQRYRARTSWEPTKPFTITFTNGAQLLCGGIEDPGSWEGPNVHFAHLDEARKARTADALKVLVGRARLDGPNGEPPQLWLTTTPRKHWLYEYFGPWTRTDAPDPFADFKARARVVDLLTADNAANLAVGYVESRRSALTAAEARVLLEAAWEDLDEAERFLSSMHWWDSCAESLPPLDAYTPLILALDAGETNDTFAAVAVSAHATREDVLAVPYVRVWVPPGNGQALDFDAIEGELVDFLEAHNVLQLCFDRYQLRQMTQRLGRIVWCEEFSQGADRLEADKALLDRVQTRHLAHDGNAVLRQHADNANAKRDGEGRLRIVKRADSLKIDALVCLSMACARSQEFAL